MGYLRDFVFALFMYIFHVFSVDFGSGMSFATDVSTPYRFRDESSVPCAVLNVFLEVRAVSASNHVEGFLTALSFVCL